MNAHLLTLLRLLVTALQTIAPQATGRLVFRLFCFVPRGKAPGPRARTLLGSASDRLSDAHRVDVPFERGHVATWRFDAPAAGRARPDRATSDSSRRRVVLIHGFGSRALHMAAFVDPLLEAGCDVLLIDLPAHGESSGRRIQLALAVKALNTVHATTGPWYGMIGHSFGGAIATAAVAGTLPGEALIRIERLALIAAPASMRRLFEGFGRAIGLNDAAMAGMTGMVQRIANVDVDAFDGGKQLTTFAQPTLIVHASDDREVPVSEAGVLASGGDHVSVMTPTGLGHRRILYAPEVAAAVTDHFNSRSRIHA